MKTKNEKRLFVLEVAALQAASASAFTRADKLAEAGFFRCAYESALDAKILADKVAALLA
jgi:hypothetical protein